MTNIMMTTTMRLTKVNGGIVTSLWSNSSSKLVVRGAATRASSTSSSFCDPPALHHGRRQQHQQEGFMENTSSCSTTANSTITSTSTLPERSMLFHSSSCRPASLINSSSRNNIRLCWFSSKSSSSKSTSSTPAPPDNGLSIRLSKLVSHYSGLGVSRNTAEKMIKAGEVTLNGQVLDQPQRLIDLTEYTTEYTAPTIELEEEAVFEPPSSIKKQKNPTTNSSINKPLYLKIQGKMVKLMSQELIQHLQNNTNESNKDNESSTAKSNNTRIWLVHKLSGELVSDSDPYGRPCVMERLMRSGLGRRGGGKTSGTGAARSSKNNNGEMMTHWKPIGRLDMPTEGLLLVTNDGDYARQMELPHNKLHRSYRVRAHGLLTEHKLTRLQKSLLVDGVRYAPMKVTVSDISKTQRGRRKTQATSTNNWLDVTCCEGKNRQIRNVFKHLGLTVTRLIRVSYGDYFLNTIPPGLAIEVPVKPMEKHVRKGPLYQKRSSRQQQSSTKQQQQTTTILSSKTKKQILADGTVTSSSGEQEEEKALPIKWVRYT